MLTLVIGGASGGKSEVAERLAMEGGRCVYVATMQPFGEQAHKRIARHLALRAGKGMATVERYTDVGGIADTVAAYDVLLLECLTNLVANEQFRPDFAPGTDVAEKVFADIQQLRAAYPSLVIVTCDVFCDGVTYTTETMGYMRHLARLNNLLAAEADSVVEVFYGLERERKGVCYAAV